jgi:hypothetical protein
LKSTVYYSHFRTACIYEITLNENAMCNYLVYNVQQQNSLNLMSNNLEIEEKSRTGSSAFYRGGKKASSMKHVILRHVQKGFQECQYFSSLLVFSSINLDTYDPKPADIGDMQME